MSRKLSVPGLACLCCLTTIAFTARATDLSNTTTGSVTDGRVTIPYRLFEPDGVSAGQKVPLILFLQGMGDRGTDNISQTYWIDQLAQHTRSGQYAAKILAPQLDVNMTFTGSGSRPTEAMSLTMLALQQEMHDPNVDTSRVYVTGLSMGAFGTWDILNRAPKVFAAAVPMSGGGDVTTAANIKDVPIWAFHGSADSVVPVQTTRDMIAALQAAGGTPRYTELAGMDHTIWDSVYADAGNTLYSWLFGQALSGPADPTQLSTDFVYSTPGGLMMSHDPGVMVSSPGAVASLSVPEPTSMGLVALVGVGLLGRRRRNK